MKYMVSFILVFLFTAGVAFGADDARKDLAEKGYDGLRRLPTGDMQQFKQLARIYSIVGQEVTSSRNDGRIYYEATFNPLKSSTPVCGLTMGSGFMFEVTDTNNFVRSFWGQAVIVGDMQWYKPDYKDLSDLYDLAIIKRLGLKKLSDKKKPDWLYNGKYLITNIDGDKPAEPIVEEIPLSGLYSPAYRALSWTELREKYLKFYEKDEHKSEAVPAKGKSKEKGKK